LGPSNLQARPGGSYRRSPIACRKRGTNAHLSRLADSGRIPSACQHLSHLLVALAVSGSDWEPRTNRSSDRWQPPEEARISMLVRSQRVSNREGRPRRPCMSQGARDRTQYRAASLQTRSRLRGHPHTMSAIGRGLDAAPDFDTFDAVRRQEIGLNEFIDPAA